MAEQNWLAQTGKDFTDAEFADEVGVSKELMKKKDLIELC